MRRLLSVASFSTAIFLLASVAVAEIYKTTDKNGKVVYTDRPPAETSAKVVNLPEINSLPTAPTTAVTSYTPPPEAVEVSYQVTMTSPATGTTLLPDQRNVSISVNLSQGLFEDLFITYFIDGNIIKQTTDTTITLEEPPRGEHQIYAAVMNRYGKNFGEASPVSIVVLRPIVKQTPAPKK